MTTKNALSQYNTEEGRIIEDALARFANITIGRERAIAEQLSIALPVEHATLPDAVRELTEACLRLIGSLGVMVTDADSCEDIIYARAAISKARGE